MSISSVSPVTSVSYNPAETPAQEAMESKATTIEDADHGDPEAIRKLANEKRDAQAAARRSPSPPGVGAFVDFLA